MISFYRSTVPQIDHKDKFFSRFNKIYALNYTLIDLQVLATQSLAGTMERVSRPSRLLAATVAHATLATGEPMRRTVTCVSY